MPSKSRRRADSKTPLSSMGCRIRVTLCRILETARIPSEIQWHDACNRSERMARPGTLDSLLPGDEPHASFSDSLILDISVDYTRRTFVANVAIRTGDPEVEEDQEGCRRGRLRIEGLKFFVIEPPVVSGDDLPLCVMGQGVLADAPTIAGKLLSERLENGGAGW